MEKKKKNRRMRNPNGLGTCYKLSGKRRKPFMVRIPDGINLEMIDGKPKGTYKYKTLGYYETYEDGMFALYKYNEKPFDIDNRSITFCEIWQIIYERDIVKLSPGRQAAYRGLDKYLVSIADVSVRQLNTIALQQVIDDVGSEKYKVTSDLKVVMCKVFDYAIINDIVEKNYATYVRVLPQDTKKKKTIFTHEEIEIIAKDKCLASDILIILIFSGMRINELLSMEIANVHLSERYMLGGSKTDAGKNRTIPINEKIFPLVKSMVETNSIYLIESNGKKVNYQTFLQSQYSDFINKNNLNHTIHETRHTFISMMDSAGCSELILKLIVGHKNKDITAVYTHKSIAELVKAINLI